DSWATQILDLETQIANFSLTSWEVSENGWKQNPINRSAGESQISPELNWSAYWEAIGWPMSSEYQLLNVAHLKFFQNVGSFLSDVGQNDGPGFRNFLKWHLLRSFGDFLSDDFVQSRFSFFGQTLTGQQSLEP